ncbi:MAG: hypothetical protein DMG05_19820 [Acidobacteria bacterium]|nr:MAG: hypothetical protein DMG05_19820 [Acidobacteriota bacterium]
MPPLFGPGYFINLKPAVQTTAETQRETGIIENVTASHFFSRQNGERTMAPLGSKAENEPPGNPDGWLF